MISGLQQVAQRWSVQGAQIYEASNGFQLVGSASHLPQNYGVYPITVSVQMRYQGRRFCFKVLSRDVGYSEYENTAQGLNEAFTYIFQGGPYFFKD